MNQRKKLNEKLKILGKLFIYDMSAHDNIEIAKQDIEKFSNPKASKTFA
jgi:hypothetical protein